jgi:hypothetical protein
LATTRARIAAVTAHLGCGHTHLAASCDLGFAATVICRRDVFHLSVDVYRASAVHLFLGEDMHRAFVWVLLAVVFGSVPNKALAQRPPVIDMHVHSTTTSPGALARLDSLNVRYLFLAGLDSDLRVWAEADSTRYLPALVFPCDGGRAPITGRPCYDTATDLPDTTWLRGELRAGRIRGFGEMSPQYLGMSPDDPRLDPYWALAEEFDIPVGIHMGFGPPGAAYESSPVPFNSPAFRMAANDPMLLEDVLLRHKRLRLFVMHAGWPRLEPMLALLYAHPHVYADMAGLQTEALVPRAEFERYLRGLVQAGFAKRIMFGSDFPNQLGPGIAAILAADYLTEEQKADIFCGNAARFLRLGEETCMP